MKYYKISEEDLLDLLYYSAKLQCLEDNGVDNWLGYMDNETDFVADILGVSDEQVEQDYLGIDDVAHKWIADYELLSEEEE